MRQTLNASGAVTASASYDPWGVPISGMIAPFGFTGELQDAAGQVYLRARWYNSPYAILTTPDVFPGWDELPATLHPYLYANNNPVSYADSTGYSWYLSDAGSLQVQTELARLSSWQTVRTAILGFGTIEEASRLSAPIVAKRIAQWVQSSTSLLTGVARSMAGRGVLFVLEKSPHIMAGSALAASIYASALGNMKDEMQNMTNGGIAIGIADDTLIFLARETKGSSITEQAQGIKYVGLGRWYILDKLPSSLRIGRAPPLRDDDTEWWKQWHFTADEKWIPIEPCYDQARNSQCARLSDGSRS